MELRPPLGIFEQLSTYLDLLLRWNARINLTAIRDPEQIVTRHFGESLFAAGVLFGGAPSDNRQLTTDNCPTTLADLGSGAGFPGVPIKLAFPELHVTLIESQNKKATFLKEVIRALGLKGIEVYNGRAGHWDRQADVVTLRAVEKFGSILPAAARLVAHGGRLCLLVGGSFDASTVPITGIEWQTPVDVPASQGSKLLIGQRTREDGQTINWGLAP